MKINFRILILASFAVSMIVMFSCKDNMKSYEELKRNEKKLINRIIAEKNIEVLKNYPANKVFGANQFVELKNGIYLNVVDSGNGNRAVHNSTTVLVRASGEFYSKDTVVSFDTFVNSQYPMEFKYGSAINVRSEHSMSNDVYYELFGIALQEILTYVGDSAIVKMIVPAYAEIDNYYRAGSVRQTSNSDEYIPIYYNKVKYTFYK